MNYADDFVICCPRGRACEAMATMREMMTKLRLTVNEAKTRVCRLPLDSFDFLGYTIGGMWSPRTGGAYLGVRSSIKRVARVCEALGQMTTRSRTAQDAGEVVGQMNRMLIGWSNYFSLGSVSKAYRRVDSHARERLRQWLRKKHKLKGRATSRWPDQSLHAKLGLVCLQQRKSGCLRANA